MTSKKDKAKVKDGRHPNFPHPGTKKSASLSHLKLALNLFTGHAGSLNYCHLIASAITTYPVVVQHDSFTWLLPAFIG